jgi:hypothetical protein
MYRPNCPLCQDNLSVVPVRAIYHYQTQSSESDADEEPSASLFLPPVQVAPPGRYAIIAAVAGIFIWMLSSFTLLCLAMALCLGIFVEFITYLDSIDTRAERRAALRRWQAAHYCGAHDVVFVYGDPQTYPPAAFAQQMQPGAARSTAATTAAASIHG